jgi:anaerobic magnesium-protoporphyrin IX monomethyl ester cyclase
MVITDFFAVAHDVYRKHADEKNHPEKHMKVLIFNPPSKSAKNVVRDLFYGCWCKGKRIASAEFPPSTLLFIYTVLKQEGHTVCLLDAQAEKMDLVKSMNEIQKFRPAIIIIPTSTMSFKEDAKILLSIKNSIKCNTIAFGSHTTFMPKISLEQEGIDFIVLREPEFIIKELIQTIENKGNFSKVKGIGYKKNSRIRINKPAKFIRNLDDLPIPDRKIVQKYAYFNPLVKNIPWMTAITSRGCPGRCIFCTSPSFYGNTYRYNSPKRVVEEMEYLTSRGYKEIFFRDETFTGDYARTEEICKLLIQKNWKTPWICSARTNTVDEKLVRLMKQAGCHMIRFGVESGDQTILNNIRKGITIEQTVDVFKWCKKYEIETHAHTMLGCVGETKDTIKKTIEFVKKLEPTTLTCGAFTPYPGTPLFERIKEKVPEIGDGTQCDLSKVHNMGFYNNIFSSLSDKEVGNAVHEMYRKFYLRPKYIFKTLLRIKSLNELRRIGAAALSVVSFAAEKE